MGSLTWQRNDFMLHQVKSNSCLNACLFSSQMDVNFTVNRIYQKIALTSTLKILTVMYPIFLKVITI
jgi:hypothetical protein